MNTVGEAISRIRGNLKANKQDAFLTDRFIYSVINKYVKPIMRRQDDLNRLKKYHSLFKPILMDLVEVDSAEAGCKCIASGCYFKRTKDRIPAICDGYYGPIIRTVSSLDQSTEIDPVFAKQYERIVNQKTFRYNTKKYYWYSDGYLYFPNIAWDTVRIEALWEGDVSRYTCDTSDNCKYAQEQPFNVPDYIFAEVEKMVLQDFGVMLQIPADTQHDNKNIIR